MAMTYRQSISSPRFFICLVCLLFPVVIIVLNLSRYRSHSSGSLNFVATTGAVKAKHLQVLSLRSSQVIYLDEKGYRLALNSDATSDFIEDKNLIDVEPESAQMSASHSNNWSSNMTDIPLNNYDVKLEESEAERDETIDYNFDLQDEIKRLPRKTPLCSSNSQPKTSIVQLKTHRSASSTLANIIYRYGDLNQLDFALPKENSYEYYCPIRFSPSFVDKQYLNSSRPHLLVNAKFEKSSMKTFMGKEAFVVTILRDPIIHFESSFYANSLDYLFGLENSSNPLREFLSTPQQYMTDYLQRENRVSIHLNHAVNGQMFDLGLNRLYFTDQRVINNTLKELDEGIDLVLIADHMDESLVLMKRALCWDLDDVLYFTHRKRANEYKDLNITMKMKEQILHWNLADASLYKYFNESLWKHIKVQDSSFFDEVQELKLRRHKLEQECIESTFVDMQTGEIRYKLSEESSTINRYFCEKMNMNEKDYIAYLKEKARMRFQDEYKYTTKQFEALESHAFANSSVF